MIVINLQRMNAKITSALSFCLFLVASSALTQAEEFYLKDGDRVVFYGDSITEQRLYTTFTESYVLTRFPKKEVSFVHSGWGGDRVSGGGGGPIDLRLERDVIAYHPTVMTIMLGMNDGGYKPFDEARFEQYRNGYEHILSVTKKALPDLRLTLIEPSPYDDFNKKPLFEGGYNQVLLRYSAFVKELGEREHDTVADLNTPVVAALEKAKQSDADLAKQIIPDRIHPREAGHLLMAAALLHAWNAPALVSAVEIDASNGKVLRHEGASVSELKTADGVSWTELEQSLPMPIDLKNSVMALAVHSSDVLQSLDQETLKVSGLPGAKYTLEIDGAPVGDFSKDQLAEGINLAEYSTPMLQQSLSVHKATLEHNNLHFTRWRQIQVPMANYKSERVQAATRELASALDEEESGLVKKQRSLAQPVEHRFILRAQ